MAYIFVVLSSLMEVFPLAGVPTLSELIYNLVRSRWPAGWFSNTTSTITIQVSKCEREPGCSCQYYYPLLLFALAHPLHHLPQIHIHMDVPHRRRIYAALPPPSVVQAPRGVCGCSSDLGLRHMAVLGGRRQHRE